ncbi:receptor-like protein EIX2 [Dioscorea cayenensis subsp. rotundata]|uniref:Receptor-like protein EIX2 n=1 Tax=Dioscorea cayennensis subsp. rotundata TaxID=55577 RepID=A0AB40CHM7_DIOCR|nr:receptor-like protein EIX2 [Dioscorea cayenensis subsp. rotundata]
MSIPSFFASFDAIQYLNLSNAGFAGPVPHQLGNLTSLHYLDLSNNANSLYIVGSHWLSNLSSLRYLNFQAADLSKAPNLLKSLNELQWISELHLSYCKLHIPLSLPHVNFTSLHFIDLSGNVINSTVPLWLFELRNLEYLYLGGNSITNLIPSAISNLTNLKVLDLSNNGVLSSGIPTSLGNLCMLTLLDLSGNNFTDELHEFEGAFSGCVSKSLETLNWRSSNLVGQLPNWLGNLKSLKTLDFSENSLYGPIPQLQLPSLQELYLSDNAFNETIPPLGQLSTELVDVQLQGNKLMGVLTETHFANLTKIEYLDMTSNAFVLSFQSNWTPPLRLQEVRMSYCRSGPAFPNWLQKLTNLSSIEMSYAGISDFMPDWFWNFSQKLENVVLSHNDIKGKLPASLEHLNLRYIDLSHNHFVGPLPYFSSTFQELRLMNNSFSGFIPNDLMEAISSISYFSVSTNNLSGEIPQSVCKLKQLITLDLSKNQIMGSIPDCWDQSQDSQMQVMDGSYNWNQSQDLQLQVMDLSYNNLSGGIPTSICSLQFLQAIHLNNNNLSGELPSSLKNCTGMATLDLGYNKFNGNISNLISDRYWSLGIVRLRSNLFTGIIPPELGNIMSLRVIDLAHNEFSGVIPLSFGNLSAMMVSPAFYQQTYLGYVDNVEVDMKGQVRRYDSTASLLIAIDLSDNQLSGEIPEELTNLIGLQSLHLSKNHFTGKIPENISQLQWLESLDLSMNNLSGVIPQSMTLLTSLSDLNLSYNHLSGEIPSKGQFQTLLDSSIYYGNYRLCGFPLDVSCQNNNKTQTPTLQTEEEDGSEDNDITWFYLSMGLGFLSGIWCFCGVLIVKKNWCYSYFSFLDKLYDKMYVFLVLKLRKMKRSNHL